MRGQRTFAITPDSRHRRLQCPSTFKKHDLARPACGRIDEKTVQISRIFRLTLPYNQYVPSPLSQRVQVAVITLHVLPKLLAPEFGSGLRRRASSTSFMPVPEAAVNEDRKAMLTEHDVRRARHVATMNTKAES